MVWARQKSKPFTTGQLPPFEYEHVWYLDSRCTLKSYFLSLTKIFWDDLMLIQFWALCQPTQTSNIMEWMFPLWACFLDQYSLLLHYSHIESRLYLCKDNTLNSKIIISIYYRTIVNDWFSLSVSRSVTTLVTFQSRFDWRVTTLSKKSRL